MLKHDVFLPYYLQSIPNLPTVEYELMMENLDEPLITNPLDGIPPQMLLKT